MEQLGGFALIAAALVAIGWIMLRRLGVGAGSQPDCGCGRCHEKSRARSLRKVPSGPVPGTPKDVPDPTHQRNPGDNKL